MLTLYFAPGAASLCVHQFLIETDLPHELVKVDLQNMEQKSAAYLALNPAGVVPTLLVDGEPMVESAAILMWLAEHDPKQGFLPGDASSRRRFMQWFFLLANGLMPPFRQWFYPQDAAGAAAVDAAKEQARQKIEALFDRLDGALAAHPYLCGESITAVDFLAFMLMRWSRNMPKPATSWPALADFVRRMKARPSFATLYEREGLTEWA